MQEPLSGHNPDEQDKNTLTHVTEQLHDLCTTKGHIILSKVDSKAFCFYHQCSINRHVFTLDCYLSLALKNK